jgi:TonB dependent receptor
LQQNGIFQQTANAGNIALNQFTGLTSTSSALTLGMDFSMSQNLSDELRLNYSVSSASTPISLYLQGGGKSFDTSVLYPAPLVKGQDFIQFYVVLPADNWGIANGGQERNKQRQANVVDNVSYSTGSHQLKSGIDYRRLFPIFRQDPLQVNYFVLSEADLINDNISAASASSVETLHPIFTNFSVYAQDSWRESNRLTLTYGLRWEWNPALGERDGIHPANVIGVSNPSTATLAPSGPPFKTTYENVAPRIGVAYQLRQHPGGETVVRGGLGLFYDLNSETAASSYLGTYQNGSPTLTNLPFPVAANVFPVPRVPAPLTPPFFNVSAIDSHLRLPYTLQWNVAVEQKLGNNQSLTASYVASAGYRLLRADRLLNFGPNFPQGVPTLRNASTSNYQSLQLQFNRRLSRGLQALAAYTYAHSIDNSSSAETVLSTSVMGPNFLNADIDRGNSDFDLRHAFRGAVTYNIPAWNATNVSKAVLGGWSLDTVWIDQTSLPAAVVGGYYFISGYTVQLRPNVVPGQPLYLLGAQCAAVNAGTPCPGGVGFNPAAFTSVPMDSNGIPTQEEGTLGRNVMRGFGAWQVDFALHRQFNLTERVNVQFRSEFFNVFNHPNFGGIDPTVGSGTFGQAVQMLNRSYANGIDALTSLYAPGGPRSIQLALKLSF